MLLVVFIRVIIRSPGVSVIHPVFCPKPAPAYAPDLQIDPHGQKGQEARYSDAQNPERRRPLLEEQDRAADIPSPRGEGEDREEGDIIGIIRPVESPDYPEAEPRQGEECEYESYDFKIHDRG